MPQFSFPLGVKGLIVVNNFGIVINSNLNMLEVFY